MIKFKLLRKNIKKGMILMKTTLKEIKNFYCEDITHITDEECKKIVKKETVAYSCGTYGVNGLIFSDMNDKLYKITLRNSNLFYFL